MRPATACQACRVSKRKCRVGRESLGTACARCQKQQISCTFTAHLPTPTLRPSLDSSDASGSPIRGSSYEEGHFGSERVCNNLLPTNGEAWDNDPHSSDPAWRDEMADHYFSVVHDKHHSLFHKPTFMASFRTNQVAHVVQYSIIALGSRFAAQMASQVRGCANQFLLGEKFADMAHRLLDMRDVSVVTIQACVLLGTLCYVSGRSEAEALYYATAARLALVLDLPRRQCATEVERQVNLRVWWTLYMIDIWSSAGLQLPRQLSFQADVELPMEEVSFLKLSPGALVFSCRPATTSTGIWGQMARLSCIWSEIQDLNKSSVERHLPPLSLTREISELERKLHDWQNELPDGLKETQENLERNAALGLGASFAALHLGYHYYHQVLFYQFMAESQQNPSPLAGLYAGTCTNHAKAFCDLLYLAERTRGCKCLYAMVGHMIVVTSTVYVHMLLFNKAGQAVQIRQRLEHNFEILTELQNHWTSLDTSLARLKIFHNACLYSTEYSFRMDRWMLRFILEHGYAVPEKFSARDDITVGIISPEEPGNMSGAADSLQTWYSQALSH